MAGKHKFREQRTGVLFIRPNMLSGFLAPAPSLTACAPPVQNPRMAQRTVFLIGFLFCAAVALLYILAMRSAGSAAVRLAATPPTLGLFPVPSASTHRPHPSRNRPETREGKRDTPRAARRGGAKFLPALPALAEEIDDTVAVARANLRSSALAASLAGSEWLRVGRPERALEEFDRALRRAPDNPAALRGRALALSRLERVHEAVAAYERLVARAPGDAATRFNFGVLLCRAERFEAAADQFRRALSLDPAHARALYNLASVCQQQGKLSEAVDCWTRFVELQPRVASAWFNRGMACLDLGRTEAAAACFGKVVELHPDDADAHYNLAAALAALERRGEAIAALERAHVLRPDDEMIRDALFDLRRSVGRRDPGR
jgi:tetratricopeptide (TPR) repeat protein